MNLIGAVLVNLWVAGWAVAMAESRSEGQGRRPGQTLPSRNQDRHSGR